MTVAIAPISSAPRAEVQREHIVLRNVTWDTYLRLRRECNDLDMTFDHGALEIMPPSPAHEKIGKFIARLVETLTLELRIPIVGLGRTTWNSESILRGLEADECYYIAHADWATGRESFNLANDFPPDLAIQVDIYSNSLNKEDIYRELRIPELWRYGAGKLTVRLLDATGKYADSSHSACLPMLPVSMIESVVARRNTANDTHLIGEFQMWMRQALILK